MLFSLRKLGSIFLDQHFPKDHPTNFWPRQKLGHPQTTPGTSSLASTGTFRNNHNPTSPSTFQDLLYFQFPSVRLIPVIQPMPLPCTTYQISADHSCTITHCSLWTAKGQDLQKVLARAGQTHCPQCYQGPALPPWLHNQLHFRCPWKCWEFGWTTGICQSTKYSLLSPFRGSTAFSKSFLLLKMPEVCDTWKNHALVLLLHLHAPGCLVTFSLKSWELAHIQFLLSWNLSELSGIKFIYRPPHTLVWDRFLFK